MSPRSALRDLRYALPEQLGKVLPEPDPLQLAQHYAARGEAVTFGYFAPNRPIPAEAIASAHADLAERISQHPGIYFSLKAPQLDFDRNAISVIACLGHELLFDAHAPAQADATLALASELGAGIVLPGRWRRSLGDARRLRDAPVRVRLVKGEWADTSGEDQDPVAGVLALARELAGRAAPVAIASHDPVLVGPALDLLRTSGTPCELEQLRGLPSRRTIALARELIVPVRRYIPLGPGWWPYAIDKALARPYLARWWLADRFSRAC